MLRKSLYGALLGSSALGLSLFVSGRGSQPSGPAPATADTVPSPAATAPTTTETAVATEEEHAHKPGMHGGIIVPIGRDSYHAEAVFEQGGTLRLFMLGQDEARVQEVEIQTLTAYVKAEGGTDSVSFMLEPERLPDDAEGQTSQFVGKLPEDLAGQAVEVTIPSLRINGERFRASDLDALLKRLKPGDAVRVSFFRYDALRELELKAAAVADAKWTVARVKSPTDDQRAAYESWLGQKWPADKTDKPADPSKDGP